MKLRIIHLSVRHKYEKPAHVKEAEARKIKAKVFDSVVLSQFLAAKFILQNSHLPVLQEALTVDLHLDHNFKKTALYALINDIFPNGLPDRFEDLSKKQKECIYQYQIAYILLCLGKIPVLYKAIHPEAHASFKLKIAKKRSKGKLLHKIDYVNIKREREGVQCGKEAAFAKFKTLHNVAVIIVFGRAHHFKTACDEHGIEHELIETLKMKDVSNSNKAVSPVNQDQELKLGKYLLELKFEGNFPTLTLFKNQKAIEQVFRAEQSAQKFAQIMEQDNVSRIINKLKDKGGAATRIAHRLEKERQKIFLLDRHSIFTSETKRRVQIKLTKPSPSSPLAQLK